MAFTRFLVILAFLCAATQFIESGEGKRLPRLLSDYSSPGSGSSCGDSPGDGSSGGGFPGDIPGSSGGGPPSNSPGGGSSGGGTSGGGSPGDVPGSPAAPEIESPLSSPTGSIPIVPITSPDDIPPSTGTPTVPSTTTGGFGVESGRGTFGFWSRNTDRWPSIIRVFISIAEFFGQRALSIFGSRMTLLDALLNTNNDAFSSLARQGIAALLNAYTITNFPLTPDNVKLLFQAALDSPEAAASQALKFQELNSYV